MGCTSFGSSSGVSMYYRIGTDPTDDLLEKDVVWDEVPFTSESLAGNLSSSQSERIMASRAYAGSAITSGEVSGSIGFEVEVSAFIDLMLKAALQSDDTLYRITNPASLAIGTDKTTIVSTSSFAGVLGATETYFAANTVMPGLGLSNLGNGKKVAWVYSINHLGQLRATRGTAVPESGTVVIPDPPARSVPIGHVVVTNTSGAEFDPGTTAFDAPGISTVFSNYKARAGVIKNASTPICFDFLKRVKRGSGFDYYVFRGVQIDGLSFNISPGSLITGEIQLQGIRTGAGALNAANSADNDVLQTLPSTWTLVDYESAAILSSVFSIDNLKVLDSTDADVGVISREVSLSLSNQLRQQQAIGTGTPYAAGVASGRFMVTSSLEAYYSGPTIVDSMTNDRELKLTFDLVNPDGYGWTFFLPKCKVTSAPPPLAESADQDLMISTELQGFEDSVDGSIKITKIVP